MAGPHAVGIELSNGWYTKDIPIMRVRMDKDSFLQQNGNAIHQGSVTQLDNIKYVGPHILIFRLDFWD